MSEKNELFKYLLRLGDNALILGQRLSEWCGHGPILEQDIAITNHSLDFFGQARLWYQYAAEVEETERSEDDIAFLRDAHEYYNVLLVEQPNEDWAYTIVRQFLFDSFNYHFHSALTQSSDERISGIAQKSLKEIRYHLKYSSEWVIRLGDGTEISHKKMQTALNDLWMYSGELTTHDELDTLMLVKGIGVNLPLIQKEIDQMRKDVFNEATLTIPENVWMITGGKTGVHTEHLGHILPEMQFMQRAYPGLEW